MYANAHGKNAGNALIAPETQCTPKSTDKEPEKASPINANSCGVFKTAESLSLGSDISESSTAIITSTRATANGPNKTGGVR
jgi:hypothetical protein